MFNFGFGGMGGMGGMGGPGGRSAAPVDNSKFYDLLGVEKTADENTIKKAYRRQAMIHHPDKGGDAAKFQEIQSAYEVLSNPDKRAIYDEAGEEGLENGGMGGGDMGDIFDMFGGGGRRRGPPRKQKGEDVIFPLVITLEEMYNGTTKKLRLTRSVICSGCDGKGGSNITQCAPCKGQGVKVVVRQIGPGMISQQQVTCPSCKGEGQVVAPANVCKGCNGQKTIKEKQALEVPVPKGCIHGTKHVFKGKADEAPNTITGDVVVQFQMKEDPKAAFVRKGNHLFYNIKISLYEALTGFETYITHLDKRVLLIKNSKVIRPGDFHKIIEEGMPITSSRGIDSGNLYIQYDIEFPADKSITTDVVNKLKTVLPNGNNSIPPSMKNGEDVQLIPVNMTEEEKIMAREEEMAKEQARRHRRQTDDDDDDDHHHGGGGAQCQQM